MKLDFWIVSNLWLRPWMDWLEISQNRIFQTKKEFGEKYELMTKKGIYPYDYMNGFETFSEKKTSTKKRFLFKTE